MENPFTMKCKRTPLGICGTVGCVFVRLLIVVVTYVQLQWFSSFGRQQHCHYNGRSATGVVIWIYMYAYFNTPFKIIIFNKFKMHIRIK